MAPKAKVVNKVKTLGFVNPTVVIAGIGKEGDANYVAERRIKSPRGWQLTTSEKYPVNKFDAMLLKLAEDNGGSAKMNLEVSINLNSTSDEPIDATGIELLA